MLTNLQNRPVEIHQVHLKPTDFFAANPSIDVPSSKNTASKLVQGGDCCSDRSLPISKGSNGVNGHGANGANGKSNGAVD